MKKLTIDKARLRPLYPSTNHFQSLVGSIISQQISGKAAQSIMGRFLALFPKRRFPTPQAVLTLTDAQFSSAGISPQKRTYLRGLARACREGTIDSQKFSKMNDGKIIEHLTSVKGIGVWTAQMFLIFALNRPDVLPLGDLAIKKGFQKAFGLRTLPDEKKMRALAAPHAGEYTALSLHLWAIIDESNTLQNKKSRVG